MICDRKLAPLLHLGVTVLHCWIIILYTNLHFLIQPFVAVATLCLLGLQHAANVANHENQDIVIRRPFTDTNIYYKYSSFAIAYVSRIAFLYTL